MTGMYLSTTPSNQTYILTHKLMTLLSTTALGRDNDAVVVKENEFVDDRQDACLVVGRSSQYWTGSSCTKHIIVTTFHPCVLILFLLPFTRWSVGVNGREMKKNVTNAW